jgi:hypothetical protein
MHNAFDQAQQRMPIPDIVAPQHSPADATPSRDPSVSRLDPE